MKIFYKTITYLCLLGLQFKVFHIINSFISSSIIKTNFNYLLNKLYFAVNNLMI